MLSALKKRAVAALRWSERHARTDMVYLAKSGAWLAGGQVGASLVAFGLSLLLARAVSPETYGSYRFMLSLAAILGSLSLSGLGTAVVRSVARGAGGTVRLAFRKSLAWSWPGALATLAAAGYYLANGNGVYAAALGIIAVSAPVTSASSIYGPYLAGLKNFRAQALVWGAANAAAALSVAAAALWSGSLLALVASFSLGNALAALAAYRFTLLAAPPSGGEDPSAVPYSFHLSAINLLDTVTAHADKLLIYHFMGPAAVATYAFALGIPEQARAFVKLGARISAPKFSAQNLENIRETTGGKVWRFAGVAMIGALVYAAAAPNIFSYLFPAYLSAVPYSQVLGLTMFSSLGMVPLVALQAHARKSELYRYSVTMNLVQLALSFWLIGTFGLWGAVGATFANRTLAFTLPIYLLRHAR